MKPKDNHPRRHRRLPTWATALLVLFFAGSGAALARDRHDDDSDSDSYRRHKTHERYEHRAERHDRGHGKYDRDRRGHRYDRHHHYDRRYRYDRHRHRYDRHRHDRYPRYRDHHRHRHHRYDRYRYDRYRYRYDHDRYRYNRYRHRHFDIPRVIAHDLLHHYRPYHHGRLYHPAHRHYHQIYRFPVYAEYGVEYYPYAYCEGNFFGRGVFRNGRALFDIHIGF